MTKNGQIHRLAFQDKKVILIGTAHISKESAELVKRIIEKERPDAILPTMGGQTALNLSEIKQKNPLKTRVLKGFSEYGSRFGFAGLLFYFGCPVTLPFTVRN